MRNEKETRKKKKIFYCLFLLFTIYILTTIVSKIGKKY